MFCPKCGQQQIVEEVRYCPRCGFQLGGVAVLVANEGAWPAHVAPPPAQLMTPRRKGMRQGGMLMLAGATLIPILGLLAAAINIGGESVILGVIVLIAGLARLLFAAIFEDNYAAAQPGALPPPAQQPAAPLYQPAPQRAALPQHQAPAPTGFRRRDTAELVAPPASVTENTTRLLDQQPDARER